MFGGDTSHCSFFYWSCYHHDLHSFPTRRSSDLERVVGEALFIPEVPPEAAVQADPPEQEVRQVQRIVVLVRNRSEEHTSELQSRQYLVCRLLLEKKK